MEKTVAITGGTGLIGKRLTHFLKKDDYAIRYLSRTEDKKADPPQYGWDIREKSINPEALKGVRHIVHLAGANVGEKRWTSSRKEAILKSRTESTHLLYDYLKNNDHQVKSVVCASAIGLYPTDTGEMMTEESPAGDAFLAEVTKQWEAETDRIASLGIRVVKIRVGVVLSNNGGALPQMLTPIKFGVGAPLGSGKQHMSWIHIDDLCRMFQYAIEHPEMEGPYNGVGPYPVTNAELTRKIANVIKRPLILPPVPKFVLRIMLGEMADIAVQGTKVSNEKIKKAGFTYHYNDIDQALINLLKK